MLTIPSATGAEDLMEFLKAPITMARAKYRACAYMAESGATALRTYALSPEGEVLYVRFGARGGHKILARCGKYRASYSEAARGGCWLQVASRRASLR